MYSISIQSTLYSLHLSLPFAYSGTLYAFIKINRVPGICSLTSQVRNSHDFIFPFVHISTLPPSTHLTPYPSPRSSYPIHPSTYSPLTSTLLDWSNLTYYPYELYLIFPVFTNFQNINPEYNFSLTIHHHCLPGTQFLHHLYTTIYTTYSIRPSFLSQSFTQL